MRYCESIIEVLDRG